MQRSLKRKSATARAESIPLVEEREARALGLKAPDGCRAARHPRRAELAWRQERGRKALQLMDDALKQGAFLHGERPTIADIALFAYTHRADEGGFDLKVYPHICAWLRRIEQIPGFFKMEPPEELTLIE